MYTVFHPSSAVGTRRTVADQEARPTATVSPDFPALEFAKNRKREAGTGSAIAMRCVRPVIGLSDPRLTNISSFSGHRDVGRILE